MNGGWGKKTFSFKPFAIGVLSRMCAEMPYKVPALSPFLRPCEMGR